MNRNDIRLLSKAYADTQTDWFELLRNTPQESWHTTPEIVEGIKATLARGETIPPAITQRFTNELSRAVFGDEWDEYSSSGMGDALRSDTPIDTSQPEGTGW